MWGDFFFRVPTYLGNVPNVDVVRVPYMGGTSVCIPTIPQL